MTDTDDDRTRPADASLVVRTADERDLPRAVEALRGVFDTHTGQRGRLGDGDYLANRWRTDAQRVVVAELGGEIVGSNALTSWGSVGWFDPLSVSPERWGTGIADALVAEAHERLHRRGATQLGLFTFAESPLHFRLYARHGYWPGALVLITTREVPIEPAVMPATYDSLPEDQV